MENSFFFSYLFFQVKQVSQAILHNLELCGFVLKSCDIHPFLCFFFFFSSSASLFTYNCSKPTNSKDLLLTLSLSLFLLPLLCSNNQTHNYQQLRFSYFFKLLFFLFFFKKKSYPTEITNAHAPLRKQIVLIKTKSDFQN